MRERTQLGLGGLDLAHLHPAALAQRTRVRERVVADPVPLGVRALGQRAVLAQRLADDEERRRRLARGQHVQDPGRGLRVRAVVEAERTSGDDRGSVAGTPLDEGGAADVAFLPCCAGAG